MAERFYLCIDLKSFFASVEAVDRGLDPFKVNLVVADPSRGRGSKVSPDVVSSFVTHPYYALRRKLEESGIIENGVFTKDCDEFKAPSAASSVVLGRSSNGNTDWKNVAGIPLKDLK